MGYKRWVNSGLILIYSMLETVEHRLQRLGLLLEAIRLLEYLLITYYCLRFAFILPQYNQSQLFYPTIQVIDSFIDLNKTQQLLLLVLSVLQTVFFLALVLIKYKVMNNSLEEIVAWSCVFMSLAARVFWFWIISQVYLVFATQSEYPLLKYSRFLLVVPLLLFVVYMQIVNHNQYIYGVAHSLIPIACLLSNDNKVLFCLLGLVFLYVNLVDRNSKFKLLQNNLVMIVIWGFLRDFFPQIQAQELVILGVCYIVGLVHHFCTWTVLYWVDSHMEEVGALLKTLNKQKDAKLRVQEEYQIQQTIIHIHCGSQSLELQEQAFLQELIRTNKIKTVSKQTRLKLLELQWKSKRDNKGFNTFMVFLYKTSLQNQNMYYQTMMTVSKIYREECNMNFMYKYELAKVMILIERWFQKFRHDNMEMFEIVRMEQTIGEFYDNMQRMLRLLLDIWTNLQEDVVVFDRVWESFTKALQVRDRLAKSLHSIDEKFKRIQEFVKYNSIMCLFNLPKYKQLEVETLCIHSQPRASYLKLKNNKIVSESLEFRTLFNYQKEQLHNAPFSRISPLKNQLIEITQSSPSIKMVDSNYAIVDANGYLHYVLLQAYLEPQILDEITYLVFLTPLHSSKEAYILYNVDTDIIEQASLGFANNFKVDVSIIRNYGNKPIYGKQVFEELDFKSENNLETLVSETGLITQMNVQELRRQLVVTNNQSVFLKIADKFTQGGTRYIIKVSSQNQEVENQVTTIQMQTSRNLTAFTKDIDKDRSYLHILDKKANLNTQQGMDTKDAVSSYYMMIAGICTCTTISCYYYCYNWFNYLANYIYDVNVRSSTMMDVFLQTFKIIHFNNWPPPSIDTSIITTMVAASKVSLQSLLYTMQQGVLTSLVTLSLPLVQLKSEWNIQNTTRQGSGLDELLESIYKASQSFTQSSSLDLLQIYNGVVNFVLDQLLLDQYYPVLSTACVVGMAFAGVCLVLLPFLQVFRIAKIKNAESIFESVQELFLLVKRKYVHRKINCINKCLGTLRNPLEEETFKIFTATTMKVKTSQEKSTTPQTKKPTKYRLLTSTLLVSSLQVIVASLYFVLIFVRFKDVRNTFPNIVNYQFDLQAQEIRIKNNLAGAYYQALNNKVFGPGMNYTTSSNTLDNTLVIKSNQLPSYFSEFKSNMWAATNSDMCLNIIPNSSEDQCHSIFNGIMTTGTSKTMDVYTILSEQLSKRPIEDFLDDSLLKDLVITQEYLLASIKQTKDTYKALMKSYLIMNMGDFAIAIIVGLAIVFICCMLGKYHTITYNHKRKVCEALFNVFPEQNFMRQDVKEYVQKSNIIERLSRL